MRVKRGSLIEIGNRRGAVVITFATPILTVEVLEELLSTLDRLAVEGVHESLILQSAHPTVFLAGAHLGEIADLDAASSTMYARRGRGVIDLLRRSPAATVASVGGSCSGGGFDLVLACDAMVVGPDARFIHPGIRRGLITGWSGTTHLPSATGRVNAVAALLETRELEVTSLGKHGAVHRADRDPLTKAFDVAQQLASLDPSRLRLWRALRDPVFIDRFHASVVHKL
jgi:enoyl-CoA hydratase/carnithine racemase